MTTITGRDVTWGDRKTGTYLATICGHQVRYCQDPTTCTQPRYRIQLDNGRTAIVE